METKAGLHENRECECENDDAVFHKNNKVKIIALILLVAASFGGYKYYQSTKTPEKLRRQQLSNEVNLRQAFLQPVL